MAGIVGAVAVLDQLTKSAALQFLPGRAVQLTDWLQFALHFNSGAAFSMGQSMTGVFTAIQLAFVLGVAWYARKVRDWWTATGLALIAGGALGNVVDRLVRAPGFFVGHVVDFISVRGFAVFNLADSAITIGVAVFIIAVFLEERRAK